MHTRAYTERRTYAFTCVYVCVYMYLCVRACVCGNIHANVSASVRICLYASMRVCVSVCVSVCTVENSVTKMYRLSFRRRRSRHCAINNSSVCLEFKKSKLSLRLCNKDCQDKVVSWGRCNLQAKNTKEEERTSRKQLNSLFVGWLLASSQQHTSVFQGHIYSDNCTNCHTETEDADQTFYITQSQYTDTGPTSTSADPITPGAWQGSHWSVSFQVTGMTRPGKNPVARGIRTPDLPHSGRTP